MARLGTHRRTRAQPFAAGASVSQPETGVYIVRSQAGATALQAIIATAGQEGPVTEMRVIVADPNDLEAKRLLSVLFADYANGVLQNTQLVDLG